MWIEHVGLKEIEEGWHRTPTPNTMLIRILDPGKEFTTTTRYAFKEEHCFEFLDIEDNQTNDGFWTDMLEFAITDGHAKNILALLLKAQKEEMNVIVHCFAGVCRSSAVAVFAATYLNFDLEDSYRDPNKLVYSKLVHAAAEAGLRE